MQIAFYAPMKPPDHPIASGDRAMGRALMDALRLGRHTVEVASRFRSFDAGDPNRQARLRQTGLRLAERLARRFKTESTPDNGEARFRPDLWFTYHLYHKAPDWLGPHVAARLGIPYVVAEASFAPKQAGGRWDLGHRSVAFALSHADRVFQLNPADAECVSPLLQDPTVLTSLPPFLETSLYSNPEREPARLAAAAALGLDLEQPWLMSVAMMRRDQKLSSYRVLATALAELTDLPWQLIVVGTGPAEAEVRAALASFSARIKWAGALEPERLRSLYRASDLFLWPAIKEAWGMAILEAQAAGLAVIAGRSGGVPAIVAEGGTGLLAQAGDGIAFASATRSLLLDPERRRAMGLAATRRTALEHDIGVASALLDHHLQSLVRRSPP